MKWVPCGNRFIEADVIRWREAVWKPRVRKGARARKIGERQVTAEVLKRDGGGWVTLKASRCETTRGEDWLKPIPPIEPGEVFRRQAATIARGKPQRLEWSEEDARDAVLGARKRPLGKFLRPSPG